MDKIICKLKANGHFAIGKHNIHLKYCFQLHVPFSTLIDILVAWIPVSFYFCTCSLLPFKTEGVSA